MGKLLNLKDYTAAELAIFLLGCFLWVIVYGIYVRDMFRRKSVEMPFFAAVSNFAWEFLWSFVFRPDMGLLVVWGYRAWFFIDLVIIYGVWKYADWQVSDARLRKFYRPVFVGSFLFWLATYFFFTREGHDTAIGANSAYIAQLLISIYYLVLLLKSADTSRFSAPVMWLRVIGSGLVTVFMVMHYSDGQHGWLLVMCGAALLLDGIFVVQFLRKSSAASASAMRSISAGAAGVTSTAAAIALLFGVTEAAAEDASTNRIEQLRQLTIEDVLHGEVTSVLRKSSTVFQSPSAVFVINSEDIVRSGARSIPDLLRMVPGMFVAQTDEHTWIVNARGLGKRRFERGLQVLVDGRTVISPALAGVFWDSVDYLYEDIERIEVVRGPGGATWGANAAAGVVNIITKDANKTKGLYASVGGGELYRGFAEMRYGMPAGSNGAVRGFAKLFNVNQADSIGDGWSSLQTGLRGDWELRGENFITLEGGFYQGRMGVNRTYPRVATTPGTDVVEDQFDARAAYALAAWRKPLGDDAELNAQVYYDHTDRRGAISDNLLEDKFDVELRHRFPLPLGQDVQYGIGYRYFPSTVERRGDPRVYFDPETRYLNLFTLFIQDEISLWPERVKLVLGSRFEHYNLTGWEVLPNARLGWTINPRNMVWAAVSRAAVIADREQLDTRNSPLAGPFYPAGSPLPVFFVGGGSPDTKPEQVLAYELGYRWLAHPRLSFDVAAFYNDHSDLITGNIQSDKAEPSATPFLHVEIPVVATNGADAQSYGIELASAYQALDDVRFTLAYTYTRIEAEDPFDIFQTGMNPEHQISLRTSWNLHRDFDVDLWTRWVDERSAVAIADYFDLSARIAYRFARNWEIAVVGRNLLDGGHKETQDPLFYQTRAIGVDRAVYGQLSCRF
jgi:iron complex outermembrane recepter protein